MMKEAGAPEAAGPDAATMRWRMGRDVHALFLAPAAEAAGDLAAW